MIKKEKHDEHKDLAYKIRRHVLNMTHRAKSSHIGTSLSMADILAVLYSGILNMDPHNPNWDQRDRFVLSKGHGCAGLYAILAEKGFFPIKWLERFYQNGSPLAGHITHHNVPGVEVSTGALGHGLSIGCGMALSGKRDHQTQKVFILLSDGECDEGPVWEAALFASHHQLDNLIAIVDYNKIQSLGNVKDILDLEPFADKWRAFGWNVHEIDGHNSVEIEETLLLARKEVDRPTCVIAHTIKGKGIDFMENQLLWHYRSPNKEELAKGLASLDRGL